MDIGGIKLAPAAAILPAANRVEPTNGGAKAVATELPRDIAIEQTSAAAGTRPEPGQDKARAQMERERLLRSFIQSRNVVDPRSRELVFRAVDTRTGEVVRQFPEETQLRLREYLNQLRDVPGRDQPRKIVRTA
jgi:flagellar protein FlaG